MREEYSVISSVELSCEALAPILHAMGASSIQAVFGDYVIERGGRRVWVSVQNEFLHAESEPETLEEYLRILRSPPLSRIGVVIDRVPGSEALAMEFAARVADRWSCLLDLDGEAIYNADDLLAWAAREGVCL